MAEEKKTTAVTKKAPAKKAAPKAAKATAPKAEKPVEKAEAPKAEKPVEEKKVVAPKAEKPAAKAEAPKAEAKVEKKAPAVNPDKYENRLIKKYKTEVVPALVKQFGYSSVMQAPRLEKIVINMGVGDATKNEKALEDRVNELTAITGQHPVVTKAKKSISTFTVRKGQAIGCKVTLRGLRMYEFYDKLVSIALPRVRDFRGVSKNSFDGHGNYTLGVKEQLIFPEIDFDKVTKLRGMDIVMVTTAKSDAEAYALLEKMGMPFRR
jgi:large subunit ribosomal protein L5